MLVQKMSVPGHGDSDSSGISTSTRLPDAALQDPAIDLACICGIIRSVDVRRNHKPTILNQFLVRHVAVHRGPGR